MRHRSDPVNDVGRIDPIDGEFLAASWSASDAKQALLEEITALHVDPPPAQATVLSRTPRRVLKLAAGPAVVAAALVVVQVLFNSTPAFAVQQLPNGLIEVNASTEFRDGQALAAELRAYGIDIEITVIPSSPSAVGQVAVFQPGGGDYIPEGLTFGKEGTSNVFNWTIDRELFTERLTVEMHVAAREGEPYVIAEEVFEPGEVLGGLHCALGQPLRAQDVAPYLSDLGITPVWLVISPTDDPTITYEEQVQEVPNGQVLWGYAQDATTIQFTVLPDGVKLSEGYTARLSDIPCTSDQAAAWNR